MENYKSCYGTSGFRFRIENIETLKSWNTDKRATDLESLPPIVIYRCGIFLSILANSSLEKHKNNKRFIGAIITASHNPHKDNGVKFFGSDGCLVNEFWENEVENLVNCTTDLEFYLNNNLKKFCIKEEEKSIERTILIGQDNRESGVYIINILIEGLKYGERFFAKSKCVNMGILCTGTLAWCVRFMSTNQDDYYDNLSKNWNILLEHSNLLHLANDLNRERLSIDTAQGPLSAKTDVLRNLLAKLGISTRFYHSDYTKKINDCCGSNYVMSEKLPSEILNDLNILKGSRCASSDGDADRIVYYIANEPPVLIDGDYILCLLLKYIATIFSNYDQKEEITLGVAQSTYSNISSINFIKETFTKFPKNVKCAHTVTDCGVKHLKRAIYNCDIGIYYEHNGHGELIVNTKNVPKELTLLSNVSNVAMGDSISNCVIIEFCLVMLNLTTAQWLDLYKPTKSMLTQIPFNEQHRQELDEMMPDLNKQAAHMFESYPNTRIVIRLSGTENYIRVFIESDNCAELIDSLESLIMEQIKDFS